MLRPTTSGDFVTLSGRKVHIAGSQIVAADGFSRQLVAKLLLIEETPLPARKAATPPKDAARPQSMGVGASSEAASSDGRAANTAASSVLDRSISGPSPAEARVSSPPPSSAKTQRPSAAAGAGSVAEAGALASPAGHCAAAAAGDGSDSGAVAAVPVRAAPAPSSRVLVYFISRPLEGGIPAPVGSEDMDHGAIRKYIAMLRASPETEVVFSALQSAVERASAQLRARRPGAPMPAVQAGLCTACHIAADALLCTSYYAHETASSKAAIRRQLLQILESHVMEPLAPLALAALEEEPAVRSQCEGLRTALRALQGRSQADLKLKDVFRCRYDSAVATLGLLGTSLTPLEKLQCLRDTHSTLWRCAQAHVETLGKDFADEEWAPEDTFFTLLHVLVSGHELHDTARLPAHLEYATRFHFVADEMRGEGSPLPQFLLNFQMAIMVAEQELEEALERAREPAAGAAAPLAAAAGGAVTSVGLLPGSPAALPVTAAE